MDKSEYFIYCSVWGRANILCCLICRPHNHTLDGLKCQIHYRQDKGDGNGTATFGYGQRIWTEHWNLCEWISHFHCWIPSPAYSFPLSDVCSRESPGGGCRSGFVCLYQHSKRSASATPSVCTFYYTRIHFIIFLPSHAQFSKFMARTHTMIFFLIFSLLYHSSYWLAYFSSVFCAKISCSRCRI